MGRLNVSPAQMISTTDISVAERPGTMFEGFVKGIEEEAAPPLGPPPSSSASSPFTSSFRRNTFSRLLVIVFGLVLLWLMNGRLPIQQHIALLSHSSPIIAQTWRFVAPPTAVDRREAAAKRKDLDRWIEEERVMAWNRISSNIGPAAGASDGVIIASPSSGQHLTEPDYYVRLLFRIRCPTDLAVYMDERCCFDHIGYVTHFPTR